MTLAINPRVSQKSLRRQAASDSSAISESSRPKLAVANVRPVAGSSSDLSSRNCRLAVLVEPVQQGHGRQEQTGTGVGSVKSRGARLCHHDSAANHLYKFGTGLISKQPSLAIVDFVQCVN